MKDISIFTAHDDLARLALGCLPLAFEFQVSVGIEQVLRDLKPIDQADLQVIAAEVEFEEIDIMVGSGGKEQTITIDDLY